MSYETESQIANMMTPDLARNPQPTYLALVEGADAMRVDGRRGDRLLAGGRRRGAASPRGVLVEHRRGRPQDPPSADPVADRSARPAEVPQDPRPAVRPQAHAGPRPSPSSSSSTQLIDGFIDEDEIDFTAQFSLPFPSQVFLTLFGLPMDELPRFLTMKDGIIRPNHVVGHDLGHPETDAYQQATADSIYEYFEALLDERASVRRDDLLSQFLDAEVDGDRLSRDDILDICFLFLIAGLDTVSASLDCFFGYLAEHPTNAATGRRARTRSRASSRSCCGGRPRSWARPGSRPATAASATSRWTRASR